MTMIAIILCGIAFEWRMVWAVALTVLLTYVAVDVGGSVVMALR